MVHTSKAVAPLRGEEQTGRQAAGGCIGMDQYTSRALLGPGMDQYTSRVPLGPRVWYHSLRSRGRRVHTYGPVHLARVLGAGSMVP